MNEKEEALLAKHRHPTYPIHPLILNRWSSRAFSGEEMSKAELFALFEAARWAPSSYNNQPWVYLYGFRNTPQWSLFFEPLVEFNKSWAQKASALVAIGSYKFFYRNH